MDRIGRYKIPRPFKDEDIWFRFFTKKQLLFIGGAALISLQLVVWAFKRSNFLLFLALVFGIILVALVSIIVKFDMPADKYLWGGGTSLETLLRRIIRKKLKANRIVYVKFYQNPEKRKVTGKWVR
ncbi:MAG: PrgI family protein [Lachnospiraceae bacterium]|nr:PrgI family protein [Lachnospiraceae bacterium]